MTAQQRRGLMFRFFIISWFLISGLVVAQPTEKTLQTTQLQKTSTGHNLVVKPKKDHHFNLEAPTKVKKNGQQLKKIDLTPMVLTVPLINNEKCELQIQTYVCDDKKTFCAPQNEILSCEQLFKSKTKDFKSGNSTVQSSVAGSLKTIKKK